MWDNVPVSVQQKSRALLSTFDYCSAGVDSDTSDARNRFRSARASNTNKRARQINSVGQKSSLDSEKVAKTSNFEMTLDLI